MKTVMTLKKRVEKLEELVIQQQHFIEYMNEAIEYESILRDVTHGVRERRSNEIAKLKQELGL